MSRWKDSVFAVALVLLGLAAPDAEAQTLYGITYNSDRLITIDPITAAGTLVGPLGSPMKGAGLGFRGNKLYTWDNFARRIQELDPATAATLNTIDIGSNAFGEGDLVFRSDGIGFRSALAPLPLVRFDLTVPNSTPIGSLAKNFDGLAFSADNVLYALSQSLAGDGGGVFDPTARLYTIDQTTGVATLIGDTGLAPFSGGGLAFDANGKLFAVVSSGLPGSLSSLYRIDRCTAAATLIGNIPGFPDVTGLRFAPAAGVIVIESGCSTDVTEGGATDTYTVVLNMAPTANVTITLNPGTQVTVAPVVLTFTPANWNVAQTVTVTAVDDNLVEGPHTGTITHSAASADPAYNGIAIASVTANITDKNSSGSEGTYGGSSGPTGGSEGCFGFGFGARVALGMDARIPTLLGPFWDCPGGRKNISTYPAGQQNLLGPGVNLTVFNVSHQRKVQTNRPSEQGASATAPGFLAWTILAGLGLGLGLVLFKAKFLLGDRS